MRPPRWSPSDKFQGTPRALIIGGGNFCLPSLARMFLGARLWRGASVGAGAGVPRSSACRCRALSSTSPLEGLHRYHDRVQPLGGHGTGRPAEYLEKRHRSRKRETGQPAEGAERAPYLSGGVRPAKQPNGYSRFGEARTTKDNLLFRPKPGLGLNSGFPFAVLRTFLATPGIFWLSATCLGGPGR